MELRDIRYFQAVAENGSITKAAQELHIAQPTISRQMQILEDELGVTLFLRGKRHIELTSAGTLFLKRISAVLLEIEQTTKEIQNLKEDITGTLSIATNDSMGATIVAPMIRAFQQKYPLVTYELYQAQAQKMSEMLRKNVVDVAFIMTPIDDIQFDFIPILRSYLGVVMHREQILGKHPEVLLVSELRGVPLILPNRYRFSICEAFWNKGYGDPRVLCDSRSVNNDLKWVKEKIGVAISPSLCTQSIEFDSGELVFKKLIDPELSYTNILAWNKKRNRSYVAERFIEFQADYIAETQGIEEDSAVIDMKSEWIK